MGAFGEISCIFLLLSLIGDLCANCTGKRGFAGLRYSDLDIAGCGSRIVGRTDAARGAILAANGTVFSAGHNFGDMAGASLAQARELFAV